ncbi:hypothetical protein [Microbacterium sp. NPDC087589]|uniref:hypothetical protein n=1 Tax=Microbacterium sp. NPDC087589 TaxID=3364191 RepID=UPI0037F1FFEA
MSARDARLVTLWTEGRSADEIGSALGIARSTVFAYARRLGLKSRHAKSYLVDPRNAEVRERLLRGESFNEVARALDIRAHSIRARADSVDWPAVEAAQTKRRALDGVPAPADRAVASSRARELYGAGATIPEIARAVQRSEVAVYGTLNRYALTPPTARFLRIAGPIKQMLLNGVSRSAIRHTLGVARDDVSRAAAEIRAAH